MSKTLKRVLAVLLTTLLVAAFAVPAAAAAGGTEDPGFIWQKVSNDSAGHGAQKRNANTLRTESDQYKPGDIVRVSILLDGKSTLEKYGFKNAKSVARDSVAVNYRNELKAKQNLIADRISKVALGGEKLDVVWNLTLAANVISANVKYGKIGEIEKVLGVKAVAIENSHEPEKTFKNDDEPAMSNASQMTYSQLVWESGYTGAGSIVAIIDTGLDYEHELFDPEAFDYAIAEDIENGVDVSLLDEETITALLDQLHVSERLDDISAADLYLSSKVPFAFNYADDNLSVNHLNDIQGEHGSHVAGIAAGNRYVPDGDGGFVPSFESVCTQGQAPDAQLLIMKYFGAVTGYDSDYFAAIEDAILLGADSVNLSLGTAGAAGNAYNFVYKDILQKLQGSDLTMVTSAGNAYSWPENARYPGYLYSEDVKYNTVGSPGSYVESFCVASVENDGNTGGYLEYEDEYFFYSEITNYNNAPIKTLAGTQDFVYVDAPGTADDFAAVADVLAGKIAICNRGTTSFFEKANAAVENGAIATIIVNNQPGVINMNLTGYNYTAPAVSILLSDGQYIKETAEAVEDGDGNVLYYTGQIFVAEGIESVYYDSDYYTMSDFSSWGVSENLTLKPEITAPGGNIYSAFGYNRSKEGGFKGGHDQYELMSGTSMAAPQISGLIATLAQYIRENDLIAKTGLSERQLATSLLMSTAHPLLEEDSGCYYPVIRQGAGLADALAVISAKSFILMDEDTTPSASDAKVKAELGEVYSKNFDISFSINNFSDEDVSYLLDAQFFTQDVFFYYMFEDPNDVPVGIASYLDSLTTILESNIVWTVNGEAFDYEAALEYDFNDDGVVSHNDIEMILEYVIGNIEEFNKMENADIDEDGDIDSYDAYLALDVIDSVNVMVPAGESVQIIASVELLDIDDFYDKGAYIEGYVYAAEQDSYDGAIGVVHSIPVLGYYGDWSEPSMFDHGDAIEFFSNQTELVPYMYAALGNTSYFIKSFIYNDEGSSDTYMMIGNPLINDYDEEGNIAYYPERNALNASATLNSVRYSQIRNSVGGMVTVESEDGEVLYARELGSYFAAHYYVEDGVWQRPYTNINIGYTPGDAVEEGTTLTATVVLANEYYQNKDGSIRWDELGEGAFYSISYKIDNTAPVIDNVDLHYDTKKGGFDRLDITATDNQYIAAVFISTEGGEEYAEYGSSESEVPEGETREFSLDFTELIEDGVIETLADIDPHILIEVYDYAGNLSTYKINLNPAELNEDVEITLSNDALRIYRGLNAKLTATVDPWGVDDTVIWSSSDDSVAVVNENGIITAVSEGFATITATSVLDEEAYAECDVEVFVLNNTLEGVLQDEDGYSFEFEWDLNDESWHAIGEFDFGPTAAVYDWLGDALYMQDGQGYINKMDPDTLEILETSESTSAFGAPMEDIAMAYLYNVTNGTNKAYAVAEGFLLYADDIMSNTFNYGYNLKNYLSNYTGASQFISIAWAGVSDTSDVFLAMDDMGFIWLFRADINGGLGLELYETDLRLSVQYDYSTTYNSMVYGDDGNVYFSTFDGNTNNIYELELVETEEYDYYTSVCIGNVGENVWPALLLGVYENQDPDDSDDPGEGNDSLIGHEIGLGCKMINADLEPEYIVKEKTAKAPEAISAVPVIEASSKVAVRGKEEIQAINTDILLIDFSLDEDATNAYVELEFDPEIISLTAGVGNVEYCANSYDPEAGVCKIAFVVPDGLEAGAAFAAALVTIIQKDVYTEIVMTVHQINDEDAEIVEVYPIGTPPVHEHVISEPEWTWADDYSMASVKLVCDECSEEIVLPAKITSETEAATFEAEGKTVYTATVRFGETEYTDKVEVVLDKLEYTYGGLTFEWHEDGTVKVTVIRVEDEKIIELEAEVNSQTTPATHTEAGKVVYLATVEFMGEEYVDDYVVVIPAAGHEYGEPVWTWSDDYSLAVATFTCEDDEAELVIIAEIDYDNDEDGNTLITASVELDGETYTNVQKIEYIEPCIAIDTVNGYNESDVTIIVGNADADTPYEVTEVKEKPDYILGDVDGKGTIDAVDYAMAKRAFLGSYELSAEQFKRADVNGNGKIDVVDYAQIKRNVLGSYTIPQPEAVVVSEGKDYKEFAFIVVGADNKVVSLNFDQNTAKGDTEIPEGGYIIAIGSGALVGDAVSDIDVGSIIELENIDLEACASAKPNTALEGAYFTRGEDLA